MRKYLMAAAAAAGLILAGTADAGKPVNTTVPAQIQRLLACRSVTDNAARLACFDRETQTVAGAFSSGDVVALDREKVRSTRRSLFGFHIPTLGNVFGGGEDEIKQVEGVLAGVGTNADGGYVFRLEDGARWSQTDGKPIALEPQRGDKVLIKRGAMGSYFLSVGRQPGVRVERLN
ncbi:MAG TPA: hypothetical protein VF757_05870 [Sphingomicrobium sp.]